MERAIDPNLLSEALGQHEVLPTPEELSSILAQAELQLLVKNFDQDERLRAIGWYLHAIGSSQYALAEYGFTRRRSAFQVSAHIFDIALQQSELERIEELKFCFAAQIAYLHSEVAPNSMALYRRTNFSEIGYLELVDYYEEIALLSAVRLLSFDVNGVYSLTEAVHQNSQALLSEWGISNILHTPFGAAVNVSSACRDMISFFVYGNLDLLDRSRNKLQDALSARSSTHDINSRWVAAHLLDLADNFENTSIWTSLPPSLPDIARKVFAHSSPRVLTLWPPQLEFLSGNETDESEPDPVTPLVPEARRVFLSTPTSGGKTMLAQLLIVAHLVTEATSVCYVAPTRSLCREVKEALDSRLRYLKKTIVQGLPESDIPFLTFDQEPDVEVMTPERLSFLIRSDIDGLLQKFGMFVFDEVHMVGEKGRGWTLEEDLGFLHYRTQKTKHRIILLSAAIGNRGHFLQWMGIDGEGPFQKHTDWRGPRRLHAVWSTPVDWSGEEWDSNPRATKNRFIKRYPKKGELNIRISHTGEIVTITMPDPVGYWAKSGPNGVELEYNSSLSTPFYRTLLPLIAFLGGSGPVLVVESTKLAAVRLAKALAEHQANIDITYLQPLIDLVTARLGAEHPLVPILTKGIAYHHGSLPAEIRSAIEDAVSSEEIKYLVATTTMTEGINLPVRSVVIASQGSHGSGEYNEYLVGSKLVNAIGRAGRATKETEGIVVIAQNNQSPLSEYFQRLNPTDDDLQINSMLADAKALDELADFEQALSNYEDAVIQIEDGAVADFLKYIWFVAASIDQASDTVTMENVGHIVGYTLGWQQIDEDTQDRWNRLVRLALDRYEKTDKQLRIRLATVGAVISSASRLEAISREITQHFRHDDVPEKITDTISIILAENRLNRLLNLPEAKRNWKGVFDIRSKRQKIDIPMEDFLKDWLHGVALVDLAEKYLSQVNDIDFRFEQLGDFINHYFELFFPWVFGTMIRWINQDLTNAGMTKLLPPMLPAHVRYGVEDPVALKLMLDGIESRNLAKNIATEWRKENTSQMPHYWIRNLSLPEWQTRFNASHFELRNLINYARDRQGGLGAILLNAGTASLAVESACLDHPNVSVRVARQNQSEFARLELLHNQQVVGYIKSCDHGDVEVVLKMGFHFELQFSAVDGNGVLEFNVIEPMVLEN
mgnify:CR=1 FL=1